jgi:hypothetical protein
MNANNGGAAMLFPVTKTNDQLIKKAENAQQCVFPSETIGLLANGTCTLNVSGQYFPEDENGWRSFYDNYDSVPPPPRREQTASYSLTEQSDPLMRPNGCMPQNQDSLFGFQNKLLEKEIAQINMLRAQVAQKLEERKQLRKKYAVLNNIRAYMQSTIGQKKANCQRIIQDNIDTKNIIAQQNSAFNSKLQTYIQNRGRYQNAWNSLNNSVSAANGIQRGTVFFEHCDYGGNAVFVKAGDSTNFPNFQATISSYMQSPGTKVNLYKDANQQGDVHANSFSSDQSSLYRNSCLTGVGFNDMANSGKVDDLGPIINPYPNLDSLIAREPGSFQMQQAV